MYITLYKSSLCPRCHLAKKHLLQIIENQPGYRFNEVDVILSPQKSWRDGIRLIPAVKIGNEVLSGVLLTEKTLQEFIARCTLQAN